MANFKAHFLKTPNFEGNERRLLMAHALDETRVVSVEAKDMGEVFEILNTENCGQPWSMSVGDGIEMVNGDLYMVAGCGFTFLR